MSRVRKNDVHWYPLFEKKPSDQRTIVNETSKQGPFVLKIFWYTTMVNRMKFHGCKFNKRGF